MLTNIQSFAAMQRFLDQYYWATLSDDFGSMLGSLMFLVDNRPVDAAFQEDWQDSAKVIVPQYHEDMLISLEQA